jgi:hypothetical protein
VIVAMGSLLAAAFSCAAVEPLANAKPRTANIVAAKMLR